MATRIERRLRANQEKLRQFHEDLSVVSEQLQAVNEVADDAELRSIVSETPYWGNSQVTSFVCVFPL